VDEGGKEGPFQIEGAPGSAGGRPHWRGAHNQRVLNP